MTNYTPDHLRAAKWIAHFDDATQGDHLAENLTTARLLFHREIPYPPAAELAGRALQYYIDQLNKTRAQIALLGITVPPESPRDGS